MASGSQFAALRGAGPAVFPSLLLCDFGHLADEVGRLEAAGVQALHLDVMDGHFVPNLSYGLPIMEAVRKLTRLPLDVHLMIDQPEQWVQRFREAGADSMTVHIEATSSPRSLLSKIRSLGAGAGIALNPGTPLAAIDDCLGVCDLVLVMSVQPGFGGQAFQPMALEKLRQLQGLVGPDVLLEVDGGVNAKTISQCAQAGADLFVVGSAIFGTSDYAKSVATLTQLAASSISGRKQKSLWSSSC